MKIKQIAVIIVLMAGFVCLVAIVIAPFMAELRFDSAEKLIAQYRWKDAEADLGQAIAIDPYNSQYPARLGEFLLVQASYKGHKTPLLKKAEEYYRRASLLNPRCAEYFVKLGQICMILFTEGHGAGGMGQGYISEAFKNFKEPLKALKEMHRVLKPGGIALIMDLNRKASIPRE